MCAQLTKCSRYLIHAPWFAHADAEQTFAGGINEANAAAYAATGCAILVTSAPYFAGPADVKVVISATENTAGERP